jgi:ankyrin repeat protein
MPNLYELRYLIESGQLVIVDSLIRADTSLLTLCDRKDGSLLRFAVQCGNLPAIQLLLRLGADPNGTEQELGAPLCESIESSESQASCVASVLLAAGAAPNQMHDCRIPLHLAVLRNYPDCVRILWAAGADIDARGHADHETALWLAALGSDARMCELLCTLGANPFLSNSTLCSTPRMVASSQRDSTAVMEVIEDAERHWLQSATGDSSR